MCEPKEKLRWRVTRGISERSDASRLSLKSFTQLFGYEPENSLLR